MRAGCELLRWVWLIGAVAVPLAIALLGLRALTYEAAAYSFPRPQEPVYRLHLRTARRVRPAWRRLTARLAGRLRHEHGIAHASIVGGTTIEISQAPWQVFVIGVVPINENEALVLLCGGSILDETHVLTAGHCLYNPITETPLPATHVLVVAGVSDVAVEEAGEQVLEAAAIRVHPYYDYGIGAGAPDDVGVIGLAKAFAFGSRVQPLALAGASPPEGASVTLTGFGKETPTGQIEGPLHSLDLAIGFSRRCGGGDDAVFLCANAPGGSGCSGDSGSGVTYGGTPSLVGVMDIDEVVGGEPCLPGTYNGFVNVAAPEIGDFVEGDEAPPQAPRGGYGVELRAVPRVGQTATCSSGSWSGSPTFTYVFSNNANGQTLQSGPSAVYPLTSADLGIAISCEVRASNAGGTGVNRTTALPPVQTAEEKEEGGSGPGTPYVPPEPPGANESGNRAAEQTAREAREAEAQRTAERKAKEESEAIERAQREFEARVAAPSKSSPACVVPRMKGDSLVVAKRALAKAHCALGKLTLSRHAGRRPVVVHQSQPAGRKLPAGARVALVLGHASRGRRARS